MRRVRAAARFDDRHGRGRLACAAFDPHFSLVPSGPRTVARLLALVSQVIGWLLIATALPRLPAMETSVILLGQPILAVIWGLLGFRRAVVAGPMGWVALVLSARGLSVSRARRSIERRLPRR